MFKNKNGEKDRRRMVMNKNYQKELEELLLELDNRGEVPTLLLHSCCAPCSSYVLEYLSSLFKITIYFYNPNIFPHQEFIKRLEEQKRLISLLEPKYPINLVEGEYEIELYNEAIKGYEHLNEGSERCFKCYELRLKKTAALAEKMGFDYFGTTLSVSPYKNAYKINEIGEIIERNTGQRFLLSDFKKNEGYKQSIVLSKKFDLYRQDYCGCRYSLQRKNLVNRND